MTLNPDVSLSFIISGLQTTDDEHDERISVLEENGGGGGGANGKNEAVEYQAFYCSFLSVTV